jgi:heme oxygenase
VARSQGRFTFQPCNLVFPFLVDSLFVYEAFDKIVAAQPALAAFQQTGLERAAALRADLDWLAQYDANLQIPPCGASGKAYAQFLSGLAEKEEIPQFMCHYYNHYFAHTAGGRMIGKKMADKLLDGNTLKFYQWEGDVKELLDETRK